MRKAVLNYFELNGSYCGLTTEGKRQTFSRKGSDNVSLFRPATQADVESVKSMGGYVPEGRIATPGADNHD